jgi:hypothetical protein
MEVPNRFIVADTFTHHRPEYVREVATRHGFEQRTPGGSAEAETWVKSDGHGWFIIRLDTQGHGSFFHGGRPHYHKDWVPADKLTKYLSGYMPTAYVYSDAGVLLGMAKDSKQSGSVAKGAHIPR